MSIGTFKNKIHMLDNSTNYCYSFPVAIIVIDSPQCWDLLDDSTVLPISRYRRSKATLLLFSTGVQLTYDLL